MHSVHLGPCKRTVHSRVHWFPRAVQNPLTGILGLPRAPAMPNPQIYTLSHSLNVLALPCICTMYNCTCRPTFVQQSSAVFCGNMTVFNKKQTLLCGNLGHIFEVAFKSTQTSGLSDKLYQGLGSLAKWKSHTAKNIQIIHKIHKLLTLLLSHIKVMAIWQNIKQ